MTSKISSDMILQSLGNQPPALNSPRCRRSESRRISERRPSKPSLCAAFRRCPGALHEGDSIRVFSKSAHAWVDGVVVKFFDGNFMRVEYAVGEDWFGKTLHLHSEHISLLSAIDRTSSCSCSWYMEHDPGCAVCPNDEPLKMKVAEELAGRGFTLRQLLLFYKHAQINYNMDKSWTTERIVRDIIIPETAEDQCSYMHSAFMCQHGGPMPAKKLVSHAIPTCSFATTVSNIMLDASGFVTWDLQCKGILNGLEELNAERALQELSIDVLETTYWLCILAVNEHKALCGDCWQCRDQDNKGQLLSKEQLQKISCKHGPKRNPCSCGMLKFEKGDPHREVDKIVTIIQKFVEELVVSVDPQLLSLKRLWILKEINEAVHSGKTVAFRTISGLSEDVKDTLKKGGAVLPPVARCEATDPEDLKRVLAQIDARDGGQHSFNELVSCMVELNYGIFKRLPSVTGSTAEALQRLQTLVMDCSWADHIVSASDLGMASGWQRLTRLRHLRLYLWSCSNLRDISAIGEGIKELQSLQHLQMDFAGCYQLSDISSIGKGLEELKTLQHLTMWFWYCEKLTDVSAIGEGLRELRGLQHLVLDFTQCSELTDVSTIGGALKELKGLQHVDLEFRGCDNLKKPGLAWRFTSLESFLQVLEHA